MNEPELNDLSDDVDYAASIQQGSASIMRSDSGSRNPLEGSEVVFTKEDVAIHPSQYKNERISGRLILTKQWDSLFMTWIPYKGHNSNDRLSEEDKNLYTIMSVPFADIHSISKHVPALGWSFIIVVMSSGLAFPPFYFYRGGVRDFIATIRQHVSLAKSAEDPNVFLVNDFRDPLQRTLSSLELPPTISVTNTHFPVSGGNESHNSGDLERAASQNNSGNVQQNGRQMQKHNDPARDLSIQVLEKFSLVTRFARETTSQLFRETNIDGFIRNDGRKHDRNDERKHDQLTPLFQPITATNDSPKVPDAVSVESEPSDPVIFYKASLIWGKPRQPPLGKEEWTTFLDEEGRILNSEAFRKRIFYGGVDHDLRKEIWTFLLGLHAYDSTYAEREYLTSVKKSEYEIIKKQWQSISVEQAKRFTKFRERKGLIDKDVVRTDRSLLFYDGDDNPNVYILRDILLTYSFYNFDLGYCQGMSDLLSPILYVMRDESKSFWCFVSLMERLGPNFNRDQSGMHSQLFALSKLVELLDTPLHNYFQQNDCLNYFFCFRWILIQFKREFEYEQTMRLWEVLWTHYQSEHLHLYVCVAILKKHRGKIMGDRMDFDTLLKFINELSGQINLDEILRDAEALCICAGENGAACIPPGTPPSLPIEDGSVYPQQDDVL
ncbi:RabGAP/TBC domain-containing protein [Striga hermonthica]|uniref:TBC1 domain family member 15 n=1 Tax=Striga hermonthica TaxID=68872 RepID=A0A9N7R3M3_STRHE|nr:RabGAP/TBC domain-containing protein [Striga hermonthica]